MLFLPFPVTDAKTRCSRTLELQGEYLVRHNHA